MNNNNGSFSRKDYLSLVQKFAEEQYETPDDEELKFEDAWIPSEPEIKKKIQEPTNAGAIDMTNIKKDKIIESLKNFVMFKLGNFY